MSENDRNKKKFELMCQWMKLKIRGISLMEFFRDRRIHSIAIYGMGEIGQLMYDELAMENEALIRYAIDQSGIRYAESLPVYCLDRNLPKVDVIVITPVLITDQLEEQIYEALGECVTFVFEEILYELSRKHGIVSVCVKQAIEMRQSEPDCEKFTDAPESLEVVNVGTTQAKYAFDYGTIPVNGFNMALFINPLMYNIEILRNNREKIALDAIILITLQYPIFLCPSSHELSAEEARRIRAEHHGYVKDEASLQRLGARNYRINHKKLWEVDQELHDLIHSGWEREIGIKGIVLQNRDNEQIRMKRKYAVEDLENLIAYCRSQSWKPILVGLPYSRELNNYVPQEFKEKNFYEPIELVKKEMDVAFYDYSEDVRFASLNNYMNVWFLNDRGRKEFTRVVYEEILQGNEENEAKQSRMD